MLQNTNPENTFTNILNTDYYLRLPFNYQFGTDLYYITHILFNHSVLIKENKVIHGVLTIHIRPDGKTMKMEFYHKSGEYTMHWKEHAENCPDTIRLV